jgi:two-component system chemotaxis response regulator CheY
MKKIFNGNIDILIADGDAAIAQIVMQSLRDLGFSGVHLARDGEQALDMMRQRKFDMVITEWGLRGMTGIELTERLRRDKNSPAPLIPIIMLTGRGEMNDVIQARDTGINEFIVKPFAIRTLFNRVEQLVDNPRQFVVSKAYVGPSRRRREGPARGTQERRKSWLPMIHSSESAAALQTGQPAIIMPSFELKRSLGLQGPLSSVITADMLQAAQAVINSMQDTSLEWLREDISTLEDAQEFNKKSGGGLHPQTMPAMKEAALSIKSRAGMFGLSLASELGRVLYLFLTTDAARPRQSHGLIVQKYIDALKIAVSNKLRMDDALGAELLSELERLRYSMVT